MPKHTLTLEQILTRLKEHPLRIAAQTGSLTPDQLRTRPGTDKWSINDVLAHLRSCSDVWGNCINLILTEDRPAIRAVSPRTWIKQTDYFKLDFAPSFHAFTTQRADLLAILEPLPLESWSRAASVTMISTVADRTVWDYAERLILHEREHVRQIEQLASVVKE